MNLFLAILLMCSCYVAQVSAKDLSTKSTSKIVRLDVGYNHDYQGMVKLCKGKGYLLPRLTCEADLEFLNRASFSAMLLASKWNNKSNTWLEPNQERNDYVALEKWGLNFDNCKGSECCLKLEKDIVDFSLRLHVIECTSQNQGYCLEVEEPFPYVLAISTASGILILIVGLVLAIVQIGRGKCGRMPFPKVGSQVPTEPQPTNNVVMKSQVREVQP